MPESELSRLVPHQGRMCLLDRVTAWSEGAIGCAARSHLDPANPLRHAGRLAALCGVEYGMQAAAAHGTLLRQSAGDTGPGRPGYLAAIRGVELHVARLDDPAFGTLAVEASLLLQERAGWIYGFELTAADGKALVSGRGTIVMPP